MKRPQDMHSDDFIEQAKARFEKMSQAADELAKELDLPPEAKYDMLSMMYDVKVPTYASVVRTGTYSSPITAVEDDATFGAIQALKRQVDELKAENLLLKEQLERKDQFISMIAHQLRGPLAPIINYAQMITRPNQRSEMIQRGMGIIISQARRLTRLVNDLLDTSRLSSGQFTLVRDTCDIVALTKEVVEQLRPIAPYHNFVTAFQDISITGNWDSGRLQQALGNLLDNAIKYSDDGTTITVGLWQARDAVYVSVHNEGASIPSTSIDQLFRPYSRFPTTKTYQEPGLGLYITKCIIEAHGGALRLESHVEESEDQHGTTFSFDLPM